MHQLKIFAPVVNRLSTSVHRKSCLIVRKTTSYGWGDKGAKQCRWHHSLKNGHCKTTENDKVERILICMMWRNFEEIFSRLQTNKLGPEWSTNPIAITRILTHWPRVYLVAVINKTPLRDGNYHVNNLITEMGVAHTVRLASYEFWGEKYCFKVRIQTHFPRAHWLPF